MDQDPDAAWNVVVAAARAAAGIDGLNERAAFTAAPDARLRRAPIDSVDAVLIWDPALGWETTLAPDDPRKAWIDLYLPICSATAAHPITVGHLGQSLDGFI